MKSFSMLLIGKNIGKKGELHFLLSFFFFFLGGGGVCPVLFNFKDIKKSNLVF